MERGQLVVATRLSPTTYYEGALGSTGLEYDLARMFAKRLGVALKLRVASDRSEILPWVARGKVDLAAAGLAMTEKHQGYVRFGPSYQSVTPQLVRRLGNPTPNSLAGLDGHLEIVAGSAHAEYLHKVSSKYPSLTWVENDRLESEELLTMVAEKKIDYTIANSNIVAINRFLYPDLKVAFDVGPAQPLAWAFPPGPDNSLYEAAEQFFAEIHSDGTLDRLMERYYGHLPTFNYVDTSTFLEHIRSRLPKYQPWFSQGAIDVGEDWRLLAAIGYQESLWDPAAVSPTGVKGVMMLTLGTMEHLGLNNRRDPGQSIRGGARYYSMLKNKMPQRIPEPDRTWMSLVAYNIGFGHLEDARKITQQNGGDPDKWVDVRKYLPRLSQLRWSQHTEHGYAPGQVAVRYVENVRSYYDILIWVTQREQALASLVSALQTDADTW